MIVEKHTNTTLNPEGGDIFPIYVLDSLLIK